MGVDREIEDSGQGRKEKGQVLESRKEGRGQEGKQDPQRICAT